MVKNGLVSEDGAWEDWVGEDVVGVVAMGVDGEVAAAGVVAARFISIYLDIQKADYCRV
jgi:hypothetical protein